MTNKKAEWITEKQAAEMMQLSEKYLRRAVTSECGNLKGLINYSRLHRYAILYNKIDIDLYIYENSTMIGI